MQKKIGKITTNNKLKTTDAPPGQFVTEKFPIFSATNGVVSREKSPKNLTIFW